MKNTVLAKLNGLNIALTLWIICMIPAPIHYFLFGLKGIEILGKLAAFGLYGTFLLIPVCFYVLANAQKPLSTVSKRLVLLGSILWITICVMMALPFLPPQPH